MRRAFFCREFTKSASWRTKEWHFRADNGGYPQELTLQVVLVLGEPGIERFHTWIEFSQQFIVEEVDDVLFRGDEIGLHVCPLVGSGNSGRTDRVRADRLIAHRLAE